MAEYTARTATNREDGGRLVREAWVRWAERQPAPKASWLVAWDDPNFEEKDREADRCIWDEITAPYRVALELVQSELRSLQSKLEELK